MERLMGVINLDREQNFLNELTYFRCDAAVPFAGRYRLIDFVISSMINSHINEVAVFVRNKYRSLFDHLGEGKQWNLDKKRGGLFILPPDWHDPGDVSRGDLRHFHNNMDFFKRGIANYVLLCRDQYICNIDYQKVLAYHKQNNADITLIYKNVDRLQKEYQQSLRLTLANSGRVKEINNELDNRNIYMDMYIINKELLLELVKDCISHHKDNLFYDAVMSNVNDLNIQSYSYQGYLAVVNSVASYFKNSMELLDLENYRELFMQKNNIYTKVKDEVPTKYKEGSHVTNSLVANGCHIEGKVKNSIIFREVDIKKGATIENSIIMARSDIGEDVYLKNIVLDKEVKVSSGQELMGSPEKPFVVAKRRNI